MDLFATRCPWWIAGPAIGLLVVGLLGIANRPLGSLGGYIDLLAWARKPSSLPKRTVFFLAGTILGGWLVTVAAGAQGPPFDYRAFDARWGVGPFGRWGILLVAGALMGYGARKAGGCTSGHGICGNSLGSPASVVVTVTFMAVAIALAHLLVRVLGVVR